MTYEYVCSACGHEWEAEQRISESPLRDCPECQQAAAKRQISVGAGFILKGSGWYSDGYSSSAATKPEAAKPSEPAAKTESASKTESVPKTESAPKTGAATPAKPSESSGKAAA
jgi:putative FmdB family regulatory protein